MECLVSFEAVSKLLKMVFKDFTCDSSASHGFYFAIMTALQAIWWNTHK